MRVLFNMNTVCFVSHNEYVYRYSLFVCGDRRSGYSISEINFWKWKRLLKMIANRSNILSERKSHSAIAQSTENTRRKTSLYSVMQHDNFSNVKIRTNEQYNAQQFCIAYFYEKSNCK
jgi:hypothetical protein